MLRVSPRTSFGGQERERITMGNLASIKLLKGIRPDLRAFVMPTPRYEITSESFASFVRTSSAGLYNKRANTACDGR